MNIEDENQKRDWEHFLQWHFVHKSDITGKQIKDKNLGFFTPDYTPL
jgi:hypothetical protein